MMLGAIILKSLEDGKQRRHWELRDLVREELAETHAPEPTDSDIGQALDELEACGAVTVSRAGCESSREAWMYRKAGNQEHKADVGKPLAGCLLEFGHALEAMTRISTFGAAKYGRGTWQRVEKERYLDAMMRHVLAMGPDGTAIDAESGLPHLAHVLWNAAAILQLSGDAPK